MKAMTLHAVADLEHEAKPLLLLDLPEPQPGASEVLIEVRTCGVCHTELDEIEGRTPPAFYPIVPGHQVVGYVVRAGNQVKNFTVGDRVGVAWIASACGDCRFCSSGLENLCSDFRATGRDINGGYAEYMTVDEKFAYLIPDTFSDVEAAPLLCAGAIGYRSLNLCNLCDGGILALSGFGASAHLVLKMTQQKHPGSKIYVLARSNKERKFAENLGADWTGDFGDMPPDKPQCIIDTTPAWRPVLRSLEILDRGGRLVINAIRKEHRDKSDLSQLDYVNHLWMEKEVKSVANVSSNDVREFLALAAAIPIRPEVQTYPLAEANTALIELKTRKIQGAKVLQIGR
ncbi:MAG: zinc-dependent alcohol dehydrogenase family protein [Desulforhopalus sp.]